MMQKSKIKIKKRSVDFPESLYHELQKEAELSYLSFSAIVRVACQDYLLRRKCSDGLSDKGGED